MDGAEISLAARVVLGAVLVIAATSKLRTRAVTAAQTSALLGSRAGPPVARALPFLELAVAIALVAWWSAVAGIVASGLVLGFTVVLVVAELRRVPCACFGGSSASHVPGPAAVLRNALLLAEAVLAIGTPSGAALGATIVAGLLLASVTVTLTLAAR